MATLSHPNFPPPFTFSDPNPHTLPVGAPKFLRRPAAPHPRLPGAAFCSCSNHSGSSSPPSGWWWDSTLREGFKNLVRRFDSYWNQETDGSSSERRSEGEEGEDWDWDRWKKHFAEVDEQERLVSILKAQLGHAVVREDYVDAARLKVAIAAATTDDFVGRVISHLNRSIKEEHYWDAAFIRDYAGAGLVGWWVGISENSNDPFGRIIRISAEYGRYVAKSYSPRQLASGTAGVPLFEIFVTTDRKGEYKQQVVYLKGSGVSQDSFTVSSGATSDFKSPDSSENGSDLLTAPTEDGEDRDDDSDIISGPTGFQNILHGMIPGVKVKVLKVIGPGKVDRDIISKIFEQIMEDEDEEKDTEQENMETEDKIKDESDHEEDESEVIASDESIDSEERSDLAVKVIISGLVHKLSGRVPAKDLQRVPAKLTRNGRFSFSLSIENDKNQQDSSGKGHDSLDRKAKRHDQSSIKFDLTRFIGSEKIPLKVLKDLSELINLTLSQAQNHQPLSRMTMFNRIETPTSSDPLNGLYIGAHGLFTSEVIHLRRKFGQWQEYDQNKEPTDLEFYEYVEALKLTGDPHVPAGQVAFRAKVGKRNQLPHKGIIPEEFGVIARYRGQGRLAEPGFRNPRWVDGELVILDGKYIKGGPVVGFVYWAPEYHFLVFFNRLRLQE